MSADAPPKDVDAKMQESSEEDSELPEELPMAEAYSTMVRPLLDLVEDLHRLLEGHAVRVPLPKIAVVGTQSSGKSSVLERLSTISLPRGDGLCTRVPLMLSMKQTDSRTVAKLSYEGAVEREVPLDAVSAAIDAATIALAGGSKGIVDKTVRLRVEGEGLPDLTLIDLPGICYNPLPGQPKDIAAQVKNLLLRHISEKETLILCVFAGDVDLQASEALALAREVDPLGERTVGCITKLDLVQSRQSLRDAVLQVGGHGLGIKLGLTAVRNRSLAELHEGITNEEVNRREADLIQEMAELDDVPAAALGTPSLVRKLCELQRDNVRKVLPRVGVALQKELSQAETRLAELSSCTTPSESMMVLQRAAEQLKQVFWRIVHGDYQVLDELNKQESDPADAEQATKLRLCARIDMLLHKYAFQLAEGCPRVFKYDFEKEARAAVAQTTGRSLPNFLSDEAFRTIIRRWHAPYEQLTQDFFRHLTKVVLDVLRKLTYATVRSNRGLRQFLAQQVEAAMAPQIEDAEKDVERIMSKERTVIYTVSHYYITTLRTLQHCGEDRDGMLKKRKRDDDGGEDQGPSPEWTKAVTLVADGDPEESAQKIVKNVAKRIKSHDPNEQKVLELQLSAYCYNKIVRKRLVDALMQVIHFFYIEFIGTELGLKLAEGVTPTSAHELLRLGVAETEERQQLQAKGAACKDGLARLQKERDQYRTELAASGADGARLAASSAALPSWLETGYGSDPEEEELKKIKEHSGGGFGFSKAPEDGGQRDDGDSDDDDSDVVELRKESTEGMGVVFVSSSDTKLKEVKGAAQRCGVGAFVGRTLVSINKVPVSSLDDVKRVSKGQTALKLQFRSEEGGGEGGAVVPAQTGALGGGGAGQSAQHVVNFTASDLRNNKDYHYSPVFELLKYSFRISYKLCSKADYCGVWFSPHAGPHDEQVEWPMPYNVRLEAMRGAAVLKSVAFEGDPFRQWLQRHMKPAPGATSGYGWREFLPHSALAGATTFTLRVTILPIEGGGGAFWSP
eukprot:Hpha_TRINITY_DN16351_c1_g2::TRINITY_DN16351_c1_g2_i12::g.62760::m.62760